MQHMRLDIKNAIRNRSFDGFKSPMGTPLSRDRVKEELERMLASGAKFMPVGDCDNFDPQTGCLGHKE